MLRGVLRQEGGGGDAISQNVDLKVWLDDGHFDVEGGDFIGEAVAETFEGPAGGAVDA